MHFAKSRQTQNKLSKSKGDVCGYKYQINLYYALPAFLKDQLFDRHSIYRHWRSIEYGDST